MCDMANAQMTSLTDQLQWTWERNYDPPNHGTIAIQNHNTIQSWLHERCECGESKDSLKRSGESNQSRNTGIIRCARV